MKGTLGLLACFFFYLSKENVLPLTFFASSIEWVTNNELASMPEEEGMQFGAAELGYD